MIQSFGYAAPSARAPLAPYRFERREPRAKDVVVEILYCGVCHSDLHQVQNDWGGSMFPMVPGHEIVGRVSAVGSSVEKFRLGDRVGVGCLVDSCRSCASCAEGLEQFCEVGAVATYNALERDGKTVTYGGYATNIVVDEAFVLRIPDNLDPAAAAPLLCAGITTYSPLRHWNVGPGQKVGVVGLGGLGHMAVKLATALGAQVVLFTSSPDKVEDAGRLGAHEAVVSRDKAAVKAHARSFDFVLDTVSAPHDLNVYLSLLKRDATLTLVGLPDAPASIQVPRLIFRRAKLSGSPIGGIAETQEMLNFCGEHGIVADVELIRIEQINAAYQRMLESDVKYRFVIDIASLRTAPPA